MIHYIAFRGRDGMTVLQRADEISTILEATHKPKGQEPITVFYLLLRNNNRIEIVGETRDSLKTKLVSASGTPIQFHELEE